jgi:predicted glycoside hydrolase/deacetylase ChbG (UPF0249 family)
MKSTLALAVIAAIGMLHAQEIPLLIRCDDIGMCHAVNSAAQEVIESGIPFSASVMFACPWYQEAVDILREHPEVSVGVHLTLNAEWKHYRWGPVAGWGPSLVDSNGYFFPSRQLFFEHHPKLEEVERELRAQIERAFRTGLRIDYLDYHMGTAVDTPELRRLVWRLAQEYQLGISRFFGEVDVEGLYATRPPRKIDTLVALVSRLEPGVPRLLVFHIGLETPEMNALVDLNPFGLSEMSTYRQAELRALVSPAFRAALEKKNVRLMTYRELIAKTGLPKMKTPSEF